MNDAYLHLLLNHFPLILNVAAFVVILPGMAWRSDPVVRAALLLMVVAALFTVSAYMTGDGAAHIVKGMQGVDESAIHEHVLAAGFTLTWNLIAGVAALVALVAFRARSVPRWVAATMLFLIVMSGSTAGRTSFLGGKIHHPETSMSKP